jgi:23S rRNA pseudouridine1911/1915/1917 synthase
LKRVAVNIPLSLGLPDGRPSAPAPEILHEDVHLLAVSKPSGLVTHPAYKHPDGTLCDFVFARQAAQGENRPCLLHRLDRETSGVVLFAKTTLARRALVRQFERRTVHKRYLAITVGAPADQSGEIDAPLARDPHDRRRVIIDPHGQNARTRYRVLMREGAYALVAAEPLTGRTHQIRAHLASVGASILGDTRYLPPGHTGDAIAQRALLHAWRLDLLYPGTGAVWSVVAPIPDDFLRAARLLGLGASLEPCQYLSQEDSCS